MVSNVCLYFPHAAFHSGLNGNEEKAERYMYMYRCGYERRDGVFVKAAAGQDV